MKRKIILLLLALSCFAISYGRVVIPMNDGWRFYFSTENSGDYARTISLPHTWDTPQSVVPFSSDNFMANYSRVITPESSWKGKRVFVRFYGVHNVANLFLNGQFVGEHRGGSTAFCFELTDKLKFDSNNSLEVVVTSSPQANILPTSIEAESYGGIYREAELIVTEPLCITPLHYGSEGVYIKPASVNSEVAEGEVQVMLDSKMSGTYHATLSIFDSNGKIAFVKRVEKVKSNAKSVDIPFELKNPKLWSTANPELYTFKVTINCDGVRDEVVVESGFRSVDVGSEGFIKINDEPIKFRGVSLYQDYPMVGSAAMAHHIERDYKIIDEMGANAIRSAITPHGKYLYDLCDRGGKMVWVELPFARAPFFSDIAYYPTEGFRQNGRDQLREIIYQNYNHPSVVMWGIFSLLWHRGDDFVPYLKELNELAKEIDPSRPTVAMSNQNGDMNSVTDLVVWRQNLGWEKGSFSDIAMWRDLIHKRFADMRSAVAYGESGRLDHQSEDDEISRDNPMWFPEGRARDMHEEYASNLDADSLLWGTWLTSMFDFSSPRSSVGENNSGLVSRDRRDRKDIFYLYKAKWNTKEPTLHITNRRQAKSSKAMQRVEVYSSDTIAPRLYTIMDTITMKSVAPSIFAADSVLLNAGLNRVVVESGELRDSIEIRYVSAPARSGAFRMK